MSSLDETIHEIALKLSQRHIYEVSSISKAIVIAKCEVVGCFGQVAE